MRTRFTDTDMSTLTNALRVAANVYDHDGDTIVTVTLKRQFKRQAEDARTLAERLEQAESIFVDG